MTFEDPTALYRCAVSDCAHPPAGNTPLCARHLRDQEVAAGATSIIEPDLEAKATAAGEAAIRAAEPPGDVYVGPDPDTNGQDLLRLHVPTWNQRVGIDPPTSPPAGLVPVYDAQLGKWILEPEAPDVDLERVRRLVHELMRELGITISAEGAYH